MAKYKTSRYKSVSICGDSNNNFNIIMCEEKIIIPLILQSYVLNWYHTYILHPGLDRTEAMIRQHLY